MSVFAAALLALAAPVAVAAEKVAAGKLQWAPCPDVKGAQCAGIVVPVDAEKPKGPTFRLRLGRVTATDPARRKGVLVILPGGPGVGIQGELGSGHSQTARLRQVFDVVTFDPRGIGRSSPIRCAPNAVPKAPAPSSTPPTRAQFNAIMSRNAVLFRSCFQLSGALMGHLSAIDTAADVEQIRRALTPNEGLRAYGGSYGSLYGEMYLERYPTHVKALVLDGLVDHSINQPTDVFRTVLAVNDSFRRFSAWCTSTAPCALHGKNVAGVFDDIVRKAPVTRIAVPQMFAAGKNPDVGWPAIAKMMAEMSRGDMTTLNALTKAASAGRGSAAEDPQLLAGKNGLYAGVVCADFGPENNYDALMPMGKSAMREAPRFAWKYWDWTPLAHSTSGALDCTGWSRPPTNPPRTLRVGRHTNVMVASSRYDPATSFTNALSVHHQIPGSAFLIFEGDGHQSFFQSNCALEAMIRFWKDPHAVDSTTVCHSER
ncbi:MAG: alpha/beta fold hydrolase [Candidatus Eremiobacteraeota bacterium]|nr:alpha/beta fold hydrolase [Candidatus Eremiobacteraeota bacterium]